jgi:hypothetical protein
MYLIHRGKAMIKVRVCNRTTSGALVERGFLECRGIRVKRPDGSELAEVDQKGRPIPEEVILRPPGVVSPLVAVRIGFALSAGNLKGQIDGLEWFVVS